MYRRHSPVKTSKYSSTSSLFPPPKEGKFRGKYSWRGKNTGDDSDKRTEGTEVVKERGPSHFINALSSKKRNELLDLVGRLNTKIEKVHENCAIGSPNGFLGVFYRYFVRKVIFNLQNRDAKCDFIETYASIFPFKVSKSCRVDSDQLKIWRSFDDIFIKEMQQFLDRHLGDDLDFLKVGYTLLSNIYTFKKKRFSRKDVECLSEMFGPKVTIDGSGDGSRTRSVSCKNTDADSAVNVLSSNAYLKQFPRLNKSGAERYMELFSDYRTVREAYFSEPVSKMYYNSYGYYLYLPERNMYELFSLLNAAEYHDNRFIYIERFQKYLFFFVHACNSPKKPVFFVDDPLFECLKSYRPYCRSRDDIFELIRPLAMLSLVFRRKQPTEASSASPATVKFSPIDEQNLRNVYRHISRFPYINEAIVDFKDQRSNLLQTTSLVYIQRIRALLDIRFRKANPHYLVSQLAAATITRPLCSQPAQPVLSVITYNAFTGEQQTDSLSLNNHRIRNFVVRHNAWDFAVEIPVEKNFTWGHEHCFIPSTIDWETKHRRCSIDGDGDESKT